jgi:cytochrome c
MLLMQVNETKVHKWPSGETDDGARDAGSARPGTDATGTIQEEYMNEGTKNRRLSMAAVASLAAAAWLAPADALGADEAAARALARQSNCFKCHAVDKKKDGPAWKDVAAKLKGKPDAQAKLVKHLTTSPKIKLEDGSEDEHPMVKSKDPAAIKNLVDWILSL